MKMFLTMIDRRGIPCVKQFDLDITDGWIPHNKSDIGKGENFKPDRICGMQIVQPNGVSFNWPSSPSFGALS